MKIAILWFGKEWQSTYSWLINNWYKKEDIDILDKKDNPNYLNNLDKYDIIYKSPWISIYLDELQKVKNKIKTQADILFENYKWKIILISWSKWKSTTSTLIYQILKDSWKNVKLVWNIWNPILSEIDFNNLPSYIVFEISSYMLDSTKKVWSSYSVLTNIYDVHSKWHHWHKNYVNAKFKIFDNSSTAICKKEIYDKYKNKLSKEIILFGENTKYFFDNKYIYSLKYKFNLENIKLEWEHNYLNICSILPICENENIKKEDIEKTLSNFIWLEHRQEYVWEFKQVKYYNDSIATIPESVLQATNRFKDNLWTIILWWKDDNFDYSKLIDVLNKSSIENIIILPDSFKKQLHLFKKDFYCVSSLEEAVQLAKEKTPKWRVCILSPWAPSYNMFKNFEQRWEIYKKLVKKDFKKS